MTMTLLPTRPALRPYQEEAINAVEAQHARGEQRALIIMPTGCHRAGQGILLYDGTVKPVEQIVVGDLLMGPDSKPRCVLALARGREEMYTVKPTKGEPWVVNKGHILTIVHVTERGDPHRVYPCTQGGQINDVPLEEWLAWSDHKRHVHKLFRVGVDFPAGDPLPLNPYLLGVLLGDGHLSIDERVHFTNVDAPVVNEVEQIVSTSSLRLKPILQPNRAQTYAIVGRIGGKNQPLRGALHRLGLLPIRCEDRFIPQPFKTASRMDRLELLAGLIDTDGHYRDGGYEFASKSYRLACDVAFLARSLGLAAYIASKIVNGATYYRVSISGDCSIVPVRIERKKSRPRSQRKDALRTGFTCEPTGTIENYFGFTLDGDGRYLLDDFTVTHNTGKTVTFAEVIRRWNVPTLVLAHREELLTQAREKLHSIWPQAEIGIVGAGLDERGHHITIASVQSAKNQRRLAEIQRLGVQLVVIDEAHHAPAASYRKIIAALHAGEAAGPFLLGVTATPQRADGKSLDAIFGPPVFVATLPEMIQLGYLTDLRGIRVATTTDLSDVGNRAGDFEQEELAAAVNRPDRNAIIVDAYLRHASDRRALVFAADVAHAHDLAEAFRQRGIGAAALDGTTDRTRRHQMLADFAAGRLRVLTNCAVLTEGFDDPAISCIILARPTQSRSLYVQMVGRGARPAPGKDDCLVIDVADNTTRHNLIVQQLPNLLGRAGYAEVQASAHSTVPRTFSLRDTLEVDLVATGRVVERDVKLINQPFRWRADGKGNYALPIRDVVFHLRLVDTGYMASVRWPDGAVQNLSLLPMPLDWSQSAAETAALQVRDGRGHFVDRRAAWRDEEASEKQLWTLKRLGIRRKKGLTKGEASDLIGAAKMQRAG